MQGASPSTYRYSTCSRLQACSWLSSSDQHRLTQARKPVFMKNKILLQGHGWFLVTLSVHKVKLGGLSEQGVSYPCCTNTKEERISCSGAGDLIRLQARKKYLSRNMSKTLPHSFTTLISVGVHQGVLRTSFSNISPGQHLQDTTALTHTHTSHKPCLQKTAHE